MVPLYTPESDSDACERVVAGADGLFASELARAELTRALLAKMKNGLLKNTDVERVLARFGQDCADGQIHLLPLHSGLVRDATEIMHRVWPNVLLRTLDAIHLATYLEVDAGPLFSRDKRMKEAGRKLGLSLAET